MQENTGEEGSKGGVYPVADQDAVIPFPKSNATISCMDQNKSLIHLHNRLYISLFDAPRSSQIALHELSSNFLIIPFDKNHRERLMSSDLLDNDGLSLAEIYDFDLMMQAVTRQNPGSKLVVCAGAFPTIPCEDSNSSRITHDPFPGPQL